MIVVRARKRLWGQSLMEYMTLLAFIIAAFLISQRYIMRGFIGRWKTGGDTYGQGRQYDPRPYGVRGNGGGTLECIYYIDRWYDARCFDGCPNHACRVACPTPADCN